MRSASECGSSDLENRNGALQDDGAVVKLFIDKVHRAAGDFDAVGKSLLLRLKPGKSRQQRGMDVENAVGEGGDERWRKQAHVAGQANQIDAVLLQAGEDVGIVFGAGAAFGDVERVGRPRSWLRPGRALGHVRDDDGDFDAGQTAGANGFGDGEEVGAAAGEKDAEAEGFGWSVDVVRVCQGDSPSGNRVVRSQASESRPWDIWRERVWQSPTLLQKAQKDGRLLRRRMSPPFSESARMGTGFR